MKHLMLSVCIVLGSALWVNAEIIVSATRTPYDATLDELAIKLTGITEAPAGTALQLLEGTWTGLGGTIYLGGTDFSWKGLTAGDVFVGSTPPQSFCNFETSNTAATWSRTGESNLYTTFTGSWYTATAEYKLKVVDDTPDNGFDNTLLAKMFVTRDAGVSYQGDYGLSNDSMQTGGFVIPVVPEPGTLVLLLCLAGPALTARWFTRASRKIVSGRSHR